MRRYAAGSLVTLVLALVLGFLISQALTGFLAIRFVDKETPPEHPVPVDRVAAGPLAPLGTLEVPGDDPLFAAAERALRAAVDTRESSGSPVTVRAEVTGGEADAFTIASDGGAVVVTGDRTGAAQGLFRLAAKVRAGHDWAALDGVAESPELEHRFVDTGAVGVQPDLEAYLAQDDYQHSSGALENVVLDEAPWLDPEGLALVEEDWRQFIDHTVAQGYNGVFIPGFLEYVTFNRLGDGFEVYPEDSIHRQRHEAMKEQVGKMWRYAHDMGMRVVFKTDMLALTAPLEEYLEREGIFDSTNPRLWEVYRAGIDELMTDLDFVDGLMVRIGEGGTIYNHPGWDYYSALKVTDSTAVRTMLDVFTDAAAQHDATIYFRTWSVGVGDVGDMHTNPDTYERLFDGFNRDNLVVSTKFTQGDFDSYLPLNPTLMTGEQQRVVEIQGRREFENFSSFPNDVGPAHQTALQTFLAENDGLEGVWSWTQDGGPWRAGPLSLYLKAGFWHLADLNVHTTARLAWNPGADLGEVTGDWIRATFSTDPETVAAIGEVMNLSRDAVLKGLYIGPYAEQQVFALGLEPPPMMWVFKWDIVSGDSAALSAVYLAAKGRIDEAIAEGEAAVEDVRRMQRLLDGVDPASFHSAELASMLASSVDYELDLLTTLQAYRETFLRYYQWVDTGSGEAHDAWRAAVPRYEAAVEQHLERWTGDVDHPPYNFFAAEVGSAHAERSPAGRVAAWVVLALSAAALAFVPSLRRGALAPWSLPEPAARGWSTGAAPGPECPAGAGSEPSVADPRGVSRDLSSLAPGSGIGRGERALIIAAPALAVVASRLALSGGLSVWYLVATLGSLFLLGLAALLVLKWLRPRADPIWLWAALGGALLLRTIALGIGMGITGPLGYWFRFWTDPTARTVYVTIAFALFAWSFLAIVVVLARVYGLRLRQGIGAVLLGWGLPLLMLGGLLTASGLETGLTAINDQMAILPLGLSRILGITTHLGIPSALPGWLLLAGAGFAVAGLILAAGRRTASGAGRPGLR